MFNTALVSHASLAALVSLSVVGAASAEDRPSRVYVIPLTGQMGTDIHPTIYEDIIEDVREVKPDLVVFRLNSADIDTNDHIANDDRREAGFWGELEGYRDMMIDLKNEIDVPEDRQIMWIEDAVGASTLLAMSWPTVYMSEGARLWGFDAVQGFAAGWSDPDVRATMYAAWVGRVPARTLAGDDRAAAQARSEVQGPRHRLVQRS
jgi:hypothetical protein